MKTYLLILWISINGSPWKETRTGETYVGENNLVCISNGMTRADKIADEETNKGNSVAITIRCEEIATTVEAIYIEEV